MSSSAQLLQHPVLRSLRRALRDTQIESSPLLLALSGGPDSSALVGGMALLQRRGLAGLIRVAHVHHHQRPEADEEAALALQTAESLELPAQVLHLEAQPGATPAALRKQRYEALAIEAVRCNADAVLTGHHADDQLETVLLALVRGAGPNGLAGMPSSRTLRDDVRLVRPLLAAPRSACVDLCDRLEIAYCQDPTNTDPTTARGRLRRDVLPVLEAMRPAIATRVAAIAPTVGAAATALSALLPRPSDGIWNRTQLARLPHAVTLAALHAAACELCEADSLSSPAISELADAVGDARMHQRVFEVGGGVEFVLEASTLRVSRSSCDRA
ncbi:MAG: tRNA lysidine(34) synthetase TilS [Phycisphaerales bacterium]|nr:tRNA lysidine(34) synthetase TilS [Phycisphaerales bacterium]